MLLVLMLACAERAPEETEPPTNAKPRTLDTSTPWNCGDPVVQQLELSDALSDGVTVAERLAPWLGGPVVEQPVWADGAQRELEIVATLVGTVTATTYPDCPELDELEAQASFTLRTDDGLFDETWTQRLRRDAPWNRMDIGQDFLIGDLDGFEADDWAPGARSVILWAGRGADRASDDGGYLQARMVEEDETGDNRRVGICGWGASADSYDPATHIDTGI